MSLNSSSILILLVFANLCSDLLRPAHAKPLTSPTGVRIVQRPRKPTDLATLILELRANGAVVNLSKEKISQPFFSSQGRVIQVNSQSVWVFSYANVTAAEKDAAKISSDGMTIGHSKPSWLGTPHFYRQRRLIILYLGDDSGVLDALTRVLGKQIAGS